MLAFLSDTAIKSQQTATQATHLFGRLLWQIVFIRTFRFKISAQISHYNGNLTEFKTCLLSVHVCLYKCCWTFL